MRVSKKLDLTQKQMETLERVSQSRKRRKDHVLRAKVVLLCTKNKTNKEISMELNINRHTVSKWRSHWAKNREKLLAVDRKEKGIFYEKKLLNILSDKERPGTPNKFTSEQVCKIIKVACESPEESGIPRTHWSLPSLAEEVVKRGIVESISISRLCFFLKKW